MSTGVRPHAIDDLVIKTLNTHHKGKWADSSLPFQSYPGHEYFMMSNFDTVQSGPEIEFRHRYRNPGNFSMGGQFGEAHETVAQNNMVVGKTKWYKAQASYLYDIDEELFQGGNEEKIIDTLVERLHGCLNDYVEGTEPFWWSSPTSEAANQPLGVPSYIVKDTTTSGGFLGGNPAGFTSGVAGINSNTYIGYRNYAGAYAGVTPDDLFSKVRRALEDTNFVAPNPHPTLKRTDKRFIFTTTDVKLAVEEQLETRNDNLGPDAIRYADLAVMKGIKLVKVPYLDLNDPTDPLYGVNFAHLRPVVARGVNMRRTKPIMVDSRRYTQRVVYYDTWYGLECADRRNLWVMSKVAA